MFLAEFFSGFSSSCFGTTVRVPIFPSNATIDNRHMKSKPGVSSTASVNETSEQLELHSFAIFSRIVFQRTGVFVALR
jgi:hypothetical protein